MVNNAGAPLISTFAIAEKFTEESQVWRPDMSDGMPDSLRWMSPELVQGIKRTKASDMWAFGMTIYVRAKFSALG